MSYGDGIELLSPAIICIEYLAEVRKMLSTYYDYTQQSAP